MSNVEVKVEQHSVDQTHLKIGILSDSHGKTHPQIVELMSGCDLVIHAGDVVDGSVLQELRDRVPTFAVAGNNDLRGVPYAANDSSTEFLPDVLELNLPSGAIRVEHGHRHGWREPDQVALKSAHPDARVVVYGHTHKLLIDQSADTWLLNPGASGYTRNYGSAKCLVLEVSGEQWDVESFEFE